MGSFLYVLLVQLLAFAAGTALVAVALLVTRRPRRWPWYAMVKLGVVITSGILLAVVVPAHLKTVKPSWQLVGYMIGLLFTSVGLVGVCTDIVRKAGSRTAYGDPKGTVGVLEIDEGFHDGQPYAES